MRLAMDLAGFKSLLDGFEPTITLFAPDNGAFHHMDKELKQFFSNETNLEVMAGVGLYHMVHGTYSSSTLRDQLNLNSLSGIPLSISVRKLLDHAAIESVNQATLISKDLYAANGVIHIIDSVLLPNRFAINTSTDDSKNATIGKLLGKLHKLSSFYSALKNNNMLDMLDDQSTLFTIFAPVDHAWQGAYLKLLDDSHKDKLTEVLKYHVLKDAYYSINLQDGSQVDTYQGSRVTIRRNTFLVDELDQVYVDNAELSKFNIVAKNGVIHIIDRVLLPKD